MTAPSTSVKYFHSAMSGAPTLNGVAGSLIAVLDACLVNGFGTKTADSVVVSGGIATFNVSAGLGAIEADTVVLIAGATPSGLNGEKRVLTAGATSFTFDATGISNQTATGTITAKLASAGWEKAFSGTNLGAYRSQNVESTRFYCRVDDTSGQNGRIFGYEAMSDINTGVNEFPRNAALPGGYYWPKANTTAATARAWTLVADDKTFWLHTHTVATGTLGITGWIGGFGDFESLKSGDAYSCVIVGAASDVSTSNTAQPASLSYCYNNSLTSIGCAVPRAYTGLGGPVGIVRRTESYAWSDGHSGVLTNTAQYPNGPDNSLILSKIAMLEGTPNLRGSIRGAFFCPQACAPQFYWRDKIDGQGVYAGRKFMAIMGNGAPAGTTANQGCTFFDIFGPWA